MIEQGTQINPENIKKNYQAKKAEELTPEATYVYLCTTKGRLLRLVENNPQISLAAKCMRKTASNDITEFESTGVIEIDQGIVIKTHPEKLGQFFKNTNGEKILKLIKEYPELSVTEISQKLGHSFRWADQEINKLWKAGLVTINKEKNKRRISLAKK